MQHPNLKYGSMRYCRVHTLFMNDSLNKDNEGTCTVIHILIVNKYKIFID